MGLFDKKSADERCSFCGKARAEVRNLVAGQNAAICGECISESFEMVTKQVSEAELERWSAKLATGRAYDSRIHLRTNEAALLIVDIQERLGAAMDPAKLATVVKNTGILIETAKTLGMPIHATEQYPKGLGPTVPELREALGNVTPIAKSAFSCFRDHQVAKNLRESHRKQIIVVGMETHVCVFQTARDLAANGYTVFVPRAAVLSRTEANYDAGHYLIRDAGAVITSTEAIVFDLLGAAGTPEFKKLSALMK